MRNLSEILASVRALADATSSRPVDAASSRRRVDAASSPRVSATPSRPVDAASSPRLRRRTLLPLLTRRDAASTGFAAASTGFAAASTGFAAALLVSFAALFAPATARANSVWDAVEKGHLYWTGSGISTNWLGDGSLVISFTNIVGNTSTASTLHLPGWSKVWALAVGGGGAGGDYGGNNMAKAGAGGFVGGIKGQEVATAARFDEFERRVVVTC